MQVVTEERAEHALRSFSSHGKVRRAYKWDVLGLAWVLAAGLAPLIPALIHGLSLGPYDILSAVGVTSSPGAVVHNPSQRDLVALFMPFTHQVWTQVHQGHLPLWNPDSGLGMPLAFNWESAPLALPQLVGYLVPVQFAFTVGVLVTVAVAGTGAYVFGRVLHLGVLSSSLVGTVFVLSGPVFSFLGWSSTSVSSWAGWIFAFAVLVVRGRTRLRWVCGLALTIAMSIYAGHPETAFLLLVGLAVFLAVLLVDQVRRLGGWNQVLRPVLDLIVAGAAGVALSAPLLLPGWQLLNQSGRAGTGNYSSISIPDHGLLQFIFQGFDGLPVSGSHWFGKVSYEWTAIYVGVIALVLAVVAVGTRWRRPEVKGMVVVAIVMVPLALQPSIASFLSDRPIVGNVILSFATVPLALALSVLAGIGLDALVRDHAERRVRQWAFACFAVMALVLIGIWIFGRGHLPPDEARIRAESFVWPLAATITGLLSVWWLGHTVRSRGSPQLKTARAAGFVLLACETAFLVASAMPLWTSVPSAVPRTPAVASLQRKVGSALVGVGTSSCIRSTFFGGSEPGFLPQANLLFDVHELAIYDPFIPKTYFSSWQRLTGSEGGSAYLYLFCPAVTTVAAARRFGVRYVLEPPNVKGPPGASFLGRYDGQSLYEVSASAPATLVPAPARKMLPSDDAPGRPVIVHTPSPSTWKLTTNNHVPAVLRLRLTDVPGWHATIDGRPLQLSRYSGVMLQARIPTGQHVIVLEYWPTAFTAGLLIAALTVIGFVIAFSFSWFRRRAARTSARSD